MIVVDPQTGMATARPMASLDDLDADPEEISDRLHPLTACGVSFVLFTLCSLLLSHLFATLPGNISMGAN